MKKILRVLHVASFLGNIGDYANHQGFYNKFQQVIRAKFTPVEIRKFYKNRAEAKFDSTFLKQINSHDLLVLGGGGFFDLQWDYSQTGTTIDFSREFLDGIKIPVLVNAMGYHEYGIVAPEIVQKFGNFLEKITDKKNWLITVRNDGSWGRLKERFGPVVDKIEKVPDAGFFYTPKKYSKSNLYNKNTVWIGLNITNDLFDQNLDLNSFNLCISQFINKILEENSNFKAIFFPHSHQDVSTIGTILNKIEDKYKREKVIVAPFFTGANSIDQVFDLYRLCSCVIGMRFHANVCCIGMGIPIIGLAGHEQISSLYDELDLPDRCLKVNNNQLSSQLIIKLQNSLKTSDKIKKEYTQINHSLNKQSDAYFRKIKSWIIEQDV